MLHTEFYRGLEAAEAALAMRPDAPPGARAAAVHAAIAPLLSPGPDTAPRACARGCDACCHFPVGVTHAEAERLADAVNGNAALVAAVAAEQRATATLPWQALAGRPCPLLADGTCAAYDARPLPCRALASASADACAAALQTRVPVPLDEVAFARGLGAAAALGPPPGARELRAALAAVLAARATGADESSRLAAFAAARGAEEVHS